MADFKVKNGLQAKRYLQTTTAISNAALTVTYRVTVANPGSGNKYYIDGALLTSLTLYEGVTYIFDQSDSTNASHPLRFSETANGTHASGSAYTTGVTTGGTPGSAGSFTQIVVASGAPTLYTYCTNHSNMGFTTTTVASLVVDLNKGNNFSITPSGNQTFAFTNPPATGKAQAFSIEVTGGSNGMSDIFSTTLYTGTGSSLAINNGINLASDGGLVWTKRRSSANSNWFLDSVRGGNQILRSNTAEGQFTSSGLEITSFNSNGYTLGTAGDINSSSQNDVSWTWKKTANFFDIVTYTGTGSAQNISHNLGSVPGMIIVKCTSHASLDWLVYHRGADGSAPEDYGFLLNGNYARQDSSGYWNDTAPTSSVFSVGTNGNVNTNGNSYVAYLFAHNSTSISCGSYTGNGSATGPVVTTGFQPQWLMFKCTSNADDWVIVDAQRGIDPAGNDIFLKPNTTGADYGFLDAISVSSTGFNVTGTDNVVNGNGRTYIYMAIAANAAGSLTWPTEVKYPAGTAPTSPALGKKDIFNFMTVDGGTSYLGKKAVEGLS
tara:strand:- start:26 stop:1672 length:1647 start_codon:yes stop_codon:yes gene_type:complete